MERKMRCLFILLLTATILAFPHVVRADVAPPINPPGTNVEPGGESTQVRMAAEKVVEEAMDDGTEQSLGKVHVASQACAVLSGRPPINEYGEDRYFFEHCILG